MPSIKNSVSASPSTKSTIEWSGRVVKVEENKTWYRKFSKEGIQYQLEEFVLLKPKNGGGSKVVQINHLWEEKRGTQVKRLLKGKLFTVSVPSNLDNNKNNPDAFQILELLPSATDNAEYSIDSVDSKCHVKIVKDLKEVPNLKSSSRQSNRIYFLQSEHVINENGKSSPSKLMNEEIGTPSPQKSNKKENGDSNISPTKYQNHNGTPNGKRKGNENGLAEKKISKKLKLTVPAVQPETPKKRIVLSKDDGSDSEDDKHYRKSLKRRIALEQQEKQANREAREKWDQQNLNTKFFRLAHRRPDEEEQYQRLIEANLFDPSPLPADYEDPIQSPLVKSSYALEVPGFKENPDYEDVINSQVDKDFWKLYRKGYIIFDSPDEIKETPIRESRLHSNSLVSPIHHQTTHHLIAKYFEPIIWADVEVLLFKELLCAYGCDWHKIASLMMSKKALQLELYYLDNRYDLSCQICGSTSDDAHLLLCDGCDRAYHLYCLDPPLSQVPNRQWFCTKECELINRMRCGFCGLKDEQKSTLLCDSCDKAFHLSCVNPPLTSVPSSWICGDCVASKAAATVSPTLAEPIVEQLVPRIEEVKDKDKEKEKEKDMKEKTHDTAHKQKEDPQTPRPPTPRTLRRKKKLEIDFSDLLPDVASNGCKSLTESSLINNNSSPIKVNSNNQNICPSVSNNALNIALGTVTAVHKLPTSPKEFNLHQIGMLSPLSSPLNKSPSPQKLNKTAKLQKAAIKIAESITPTFIYDDIRVYASKCVKEINFLGLREDNLAQVSYSTLFTYFPDVSESKLGDLFDSILTAVDAVVNRAIANPVFCSQLTPLQQQEHDQRLFAYVHVKKSNNTQSTNNNNNKTTNHTSNRTPTNKIIRPRKKIRKPLPNTPTRSPTTPTPRRKSEKEDDDGFGTQPRAWIFQANNTMYNIEKSVKELKHMTWFIKQHIHKIRAGDRVFIWVSGKEAGVIAVGTVLTDPANIAEAKGMKEYYLSAKMFNVVALRSVLRIDYVLSKRIEKAKLAKHSVLSKLTILRQPIGTNFKLTKVEATNLEQFITEAAGSDINELIPAFSKDDVPEVLAQMNAPKSDDNNNNNNNTQPVLDNNASDTTNITNYVSPTPDPAPPAESPPAESMEVDTKCEVCNCTTGDDQMLLCDGCDKGYHIYCLNPPLEHIPEDSWFCQACVHKVSHCKICDGTTSEQTPLVVCHQCHVACHSTCLAAPAIEIQPEMKWFCNDCQLSPQEITACKLYIGFQELHLVCRRLIQDKCEEVSRQHKKNMQANHPTKKVISRLQHLIAQLSQMRLNVLNSANLSFQAWKESLVDSSTQLPNCNNINHLKMDEDL